MNYEMGATILSKTVKEKYLVVTMNESVKRSAMSCATYRARQQNVHLSSLHTDTLQLLCVSVALLRCNKHKESRAHPMQGTSLCILRLCDAFRQSRFTDTGARTETRNPRRGLQGGHAPVTTLHVGFIHTETQELQPAKRKPTIYPAIEHD